MKLKKRGVTLIEIIIAIIIFGVGILSIMVMINNNAGALNRIKVRTNGVFLAKEGIELIYNLRDSNIKKGLEWNCAQLNARYECIDKFENNKTYQISINNNGYIKINSTNTDFDSNKIYYHTGDIRTNNNDLLFTGFWYDYDDTGEETWYSRYILFSGAYLEATDSIVDPNKLLNLEVHVDFKKGGYTGDYILESFIGETR